MIALGLDIARFCKKKFKLKNTHFQKSILTQEGFSSNLRASSTTLQLDQFLWPSQILLVCIYSLGKGSATPDTRQLQTTPPRIVYNYVVEHTYSTVCTACTAAYSLQL